MWGVMVSPPACKPEVCR